MLKVEAPAAPVADERYHDREGSAAYARSKGLTKVTEQTIVRATYYGTKKLRRTKIGGRVYWAESALDDWIASCSLGGENAR
jgi:hypothetical protein